MSQKKKMILLVIATIALMLIIIFLVGRSFGFFKYIKKGENVNVITINGIEVKIENPEVDSLNLENAYPVDDSEGMTYTPFVFTMTNTSSKALSYSIVVENDEEKQAECVIDDNLICPELSTDYIKYSYKKNDGTYTEPRNLGSDNNIIASDVIVGGETVTSSIILWIDSEAGNEIMNHYFFGKIIITGEQAVTKNLKDTILSENTLIEAEPTLTTSSNNTSDTSGLYKSTETNNGESTYYFRGNVENNYVRFAGTTWRIIRINEDGTIRLIMQDGISVNDVAYYSFNSSADTKEYMYYSNSGADGAKYQLEKWYKDNIESNANYSSKLVSGDYFCEQAKVVVMDKYTTNSGASMIAYKSYTPNFKCETDENGYGIVSSNIGLINYDELVYAGGYYNQSNNNYYLYNNDNFWTMSPGGFYESLSYDWIAWSTSVVSINNVNSTARLRPVLILKADTNVTGSGTSLSPYTVQ